MKISSEDLRKEAARKRLQRRLAKQGLMAYTRYTFPGYRPSDDHYALCEKLDEVEANTCKRLIVNMGPRHGKSELVSRRFPSKFLGTHQQRSFGHVSYGQTFADDFGEDVRNIISTPKYFNLYNIGLSHSTAAKNKWKTTAGGSYFAVGIGGPMTGRGYDVLNVDDPHKDRKEASSEQQRNTVWKWFTGTAYTRLESDILIPDDEWNWLFENPDVGLKEGLIKPFEGAIIVTQTRWEEDDLTGKLLEAMDKGGEQYEIINLPSSDEKITYAAWPEKYPVEALKRIKQSIGSKEYSAQYLQNPTPDDGVYYTRDMFEKRWSVLPSNLEYFAAADFALTQDGGDFTEIGIFGVDASRTIYVCDWYTGQDDALVWINQLFTMHKRWKFSWLAAEPGNIKLATESTIKEKMRENGQFFGLIYIPGGNSKPANATSFKVLQSGGRVYWPEVGHGSTPDQRKLVDITNRIIEQMIKAFSGRNDDGIDATSNFGIKITDAWGGKALVEKETRPEPKRGLIRCEGPKW